MTDTGVLDWERTAVFNVDNQRYHGQLPSLAGDDDPDWDGVVDVPATGTMTLRLVPNTGSIPSAAAEFIDVARGDSPASTTPATVTLDRAVWESAGSNNGQPTIDVIAELSGLSFDETGVVVLKHEDQVVGLTRYSGEESLSLEAHQFSADPALVCITAEMWNLAGETV